MLRSIMYSHVKDTRKEEQSHYLDMQIFKKKYHAMYNVNVRQPIGGSHHSERVTNIFVTSAS